MPACLILLSNSFVFQIPCSWDLKLARHMAAHTIAHGSMLPCSALVSLRRAALALRWNYLLLVCERCTIERRKTKLFRTYCKTVDRWWLEIYTIVSQDQNRAQSHPILLTLPLFLAAGTGLKSLLPSFLLWPLMRRDGSQPDPKS